MNIIKCCFPRFAIGSQPDQQLSAGDGAGYSLQDWMAYHSAQLSDRPLDQVILPGTHDAGAYTTANVSLSGFKGEKLLLAMLRLTPWLVKPWMLTQELDITQQLNSGIRFFDFRLSLHFQGSDEPPVIYISHTLPCLPFETVLNQLGAWLSAHSQEVVLIRLTQDHAHRHSWQPCHTLEAWTSMQSILGQHLCCKAGFNLPAGQLLPTVGDVVSCGKRLLVLLELDVQADPRLAQEVVSSCELHEGYTKCICDASCYITASNPPAVNHCDKIPVVMGNGIPSDGPGFKDSKPAAGQLRGDGHKTITKDGIRHVSYCSEEDKWAELLSSVWGPGFSDSLWANSTTAEGTIKGLIEQIQQNQGGNRHTGHPCAINSFHRTSSVMCHTGWPCMGSEQDSDVDLSTTERMAGMYSNQVQSYRYAAAAVTPTVDGVIENLLHAHGSTLRTYARQVKQLLPHLLSIDLTGVSCISTDFPDAETVTAIIQKNFAVKG